MADGDRMLTEGEAYALVEDGIRRETAAATTRITELEAENAKLKTELDVLETQKASAETAVETAKKELEDYKAEQERQLAEAKVRDERLDKVRAASPKLEINDERTARIVAMSDEVFEEYLGAITAAAGTSSTEGKEETPEGGLPRESAALRGGGDGNDNSPVMSLFAARRGETKSA